MDHKTCGSSIATVPAATAGTHPKSEPQQLHYFVTQLVLACSRAAALALATYTFAVTAWRARREPGDLAFVVGAYAALAALLLCLRRAERLTAPAADSPHAAAAGAERRRRRLHAAVWALSAALSCAFAYRVSLLVPAALVVVVWGMTSFVVLVGFYLLVLSEDQQYQSVDDVDCDASGDGQPLLKKIRPTDEMV